MHQFDEFLAGIHYIICSYSRGNSPNRSGYYSAKVYELNGTLIQETTEVSGEDSEATHARLELLGIEAALEQLGPTEFPVLCLTRQEYIPKHIANLRANDFRKAGGVEAANADIWRRIAALDPKGKIEWHFTNRDLDEEVEDRIAEQENEMWMERAKSRDPWDES